MWQIIKNHSGKPGNNQISTNLTASDFNYLFVNIAENLIKNIDKADRGPTDYFNANTHARFDFGPFSYIETRDAIVSLKDSASKDPYGVQ
nr:unnamed protein product [Callosobruchus analis]